MYGFIYLIKMEFVKIKAYLENCIESYVTN